MTIKPKQKGEKIKSVNKELETAFMEPTDFNVTPLYYQTKGFNHWN